MWGWEPREFTEHHYRDGVLIGSTTTREPEFDTEQVALLLAHARAEADIGSHGQPMSEATSPDADRSRPGGWHYTGNKAPLMDFAAQSLAQRQEAYYKNLPDGTSRAGHLWQTYRVDDE